MRKHELAAMLTGSRLVRLAQSCDPSLMFPGSARVHVRHDWMIHPATLKQLADDYQERPIFTVLLPGVICLFIQNIRYGTIMNDIY